LGRTPLGVRPNTVPRGSRCLFARLIRRRSARRRISQRRCL